MRSVSGVGVSSSCPPDAERHSKNPASAGEERIAHHYIEGSPLTLVSRASETSPPGSRLAAKNGRPTSEFQAQNQLHLTGCFVERGDGGEARLPALAAILRHTEVILTELRLRVVEIGVVENVEGVRAEGEPAGFA